MKTYAWLTMSLIGASICFWLFFKSFHMNFLLAAAFFLAGAAFQANAIRLKRRYAWARFLFMKD
ncbi:MAG TPA: hypothetical protein PKA63_13235 [Oligoflexia bacterium]|nr:hypothetical protein [Oligoflexia bacterium]HMP49624.1 hypothetical protein [Oligoflexia bacterium]